MILPAARAPHLRKIVFFISMATGVYTNAQPAMLQASDIDWVGFEDLSPGQRALLPDNCCGMYVQPPLPALRGEPGSANLGADVLDARDGNRILLEGNIDIRQEDIWVQADSGVYDYDTGNATVTGNIRIRQPGMLLAGSDGSVEDAGGTSRINNASYVLHEDMVRGSADVIVYTDSDGVITIDNGLYTRCEPGNNSWVVEGRSIELNQVTGRGLARDVKVRINDVPVLYLPVITFPINDERATGFLAPAIGSTRDGGLDVSTPYYLNLAPNYDATLTPRLMTDRGVMLGAEARYLGRRSLSSLQMNYLPDDDLFDPAELLLPDPVSPPVPDRWQVAFDHVSRLSRNWTALADYAAVSDEDYFQDLGNTGLYTTTQSFLFRQGGVRYRNDNWRFRVQALSYQVIDPAILEQSQPFERLPKIDLDGSFGSPLGFEYGIRSEYVHFDRDLNPDRLTPAQIAAGELVTGQRLAIEPEISYPWSSPGAFVTPGLKYKYASYQLDDPGGAFTEDPSRGIVTGTLDSGLIFERDLDGGDMIQTLEPRLYYLYSEYEDQDDIPVFDSTAMTFSFNQLFREDRFSGRDRVGDTSQATLAVSSRFLDAGGKEKARISIGQIRYFRDRRVTINNRPGEAERASGSSVAGEMTFRVNANWRMNSYLEWNTQESSLDVGNFQFRYQSDINHILNFSYRFRDVPDPITASGIDRRIRQTDISAVWPVKDNWGLIGRWNYDHANSRNLESIAGVEYNNCCWRARIIARKWIDNDALFYGNEDDNTGVFLQFELKGFGSVIGGNVSGILNNGISGYREREYDQ